MFANHMIISVQLKCLYHDSGDERIQKYAMTRILTVAKVSNTMEMGKYLFLKMERGQKIWGKAVGSIKTRGIMKSGTTGDSS